MKPGLQLHPQPAYGFYLNRNACCFSLNPLAASPSIVSPALASPATVSPACALSATATLAASPSTCLLLHPQLLARLAASPATRLLLRPQLACSFTNNRNPLTASTSTATLAASPSLAASPPTVNYIYCFSLDSNACCLTRNLESRLQFHPQPLARLATSPSTCLLLHLQHACRFALNRKPGVGFTRNREPSVGFTRNREPCLPLHLQPQPGYSNNYFRLSLTPIKPFEFSPVLFLAIEQLFNCSIVQLFNNQLR